MNEFFTWEFLATFGGMLAFVALVTEVAKFYIKVDPKWIALCATILGQIAVQFVFLKDFSVEGIVLAIFNMFAVLSSSVGLFEIVVKPVERKLNSKKA